ncbi:MAG: hypothetical protein ACM3KR_00660 [Deltaproteobacteria bacterium]
MLDVLTWADDMYPIVLKRFQDRLDKRTDLIKSVIGYEPLKTSNQYADEGMGGYGYVPDYNGTAITELNQKRGFKTTYTPKEKAAKATVQYKYAKIDQSGEAKKAANKMADSLAMTQVRDFYNLFAKGFNASITGADGVSLFNSAHKVNNTDADTFSNTGTSAFSIAAITDSQTKAQRFKTFDGLDFDCDFDLCLIAPELEPKAKEFFGKEAKLIPESAENGANPVAGMKYVVIKGFTAKQWAVADSLLLKDYLKMVEITAPMVIPNKPDNPLIQEYIGYMDYVMGWSDARAIFGHNPA